MRLSFLIIAILISSCGQMFEDTETLTSSAAVRARVNSLTNDDMKLAEKIKPFVGNFLTVQETVNWKKKNPRDGQSSLDSYINSSEFDRIIYDREQYIYRNYTLYFESKANIKNLTGEGYIGVCWRDIKTIAVQKEWWDSVSEDWKKILILHELGHCYLKRSHETKKRSVMESVLIYPSEYNDDKDYYDKELFGM